MVSSIRIGEHVHLVGVAGGVFCGRVLDQECDDWDFDPGEPVDCPDCLQIARTLAHRLGADPRDYFPAEDEPEDFPEPPWLVCQSGAL